MTSIEARLRAAGLPSLPRTAWLEVDLDRLAGNVAAIRRVLPAATHVEAVVKADGYGHGAVPVAVTVLEAGARGLCVASLDEALELRAAGIQAPVLVLFPVPPDGVAVAARAEIELTAGAGDLLERMLSAHAVARRRARRPIPTLGVQLALETGLGRDGITAGEALRIARQIVAAPGVELRGAWSHLQAPLDGSRTDGQVVAFEAILAALREEGIEIPHRHLLASGGLRDVERLVAGRQPLFDGLRVGLAAYGMVPEDARDMAPRGPVRARLEPVLSLHARPVRVADLPAGTGISYGPSFVTERPSRIATLPVGYADGWSRALSNRSAALVRGHRVPLVGTVAMDAVMADVTDVPGSPVTPDDEFVLLGTQEPEAITAGEVAEARGSISWEVIATMSRRLTRVYTARALTVGIRTLTEDRGSWRSSPSGTATSATSRSTRS